MKKFLAGLGRAILVILIVDIVCTLIWVWGVFKYFEETPEPQAPVAVVLMGDFDERSGELGEETQRRLDYALMLHHEGEVEYVLCVGGARPRLNMYGAEYMRNFLIEKGMPEGKVFLERQSYDSRTNWLVTKELLKSYGLRRAMIISSPFHLFRFRQILLADPPQYLKIYLSPYSLKEAHPKASYWDMWVEVHYQWAAHYARMLPKNMYDKLVGHIRSL